MSDASGFLYRGIHAGHPAMADARLGTCKPGKLSGAASARDHNVGSAQTDSPYTSWTVHYDVARRFAERLGPGGVILRARAGRPPAGASWRWDGTGGDEWSEGEMLLWGIRTGLDVECL